MVFWIYQSCNEMRTSRDGVLDVPVTSRDGVLDVPVM